jgi:transcriptional regulator with XRE-family HTH domain
MEKKTIGKFISVLRRANGMTQKELGDKLYVSDKTVSRWERDECLPELSLIPAIAEIFGVTTDELLRGERNSIEKDSIAPTESKRVRGEKQFKAMLHQNEKKFSNLSFISIGLTLAGIIVAALCNGFYKSILGGLLGILFFIAAAICQICFTNAFSIADYEDEHEEEVKATNTRHIE